MASRVKDSNEPTKLSLAVNDIEFRTLTLLRALAESLPEMLRLVLKGNGCRMVPVEAQPTARTNFPFA